MIKVLHWLPRILCIAAILFISMFAADAFAPGLTFLQQIGAFIMHLIPSIILLAFLIIAWKWELIGGSIFVAIGLAFTPFIYSHNFNMNHSVATTIGIVLMINFPFVVTGILFILSHFTKKSNLQKS
jgi:hypothetical protein